MNYDAQLLLIGAVAVVGVLHTIVPDHWVPITLIARQRGWTKAETISAAIKAGTGHVLSTLAIALVVWFAGVAVATHFGHMVDLASSIALMAFGLWIAIGAWLEMRQGGHGHSHSHDHGHENPHPHDHGHEDHHHHDDHSHSHDHDHPHKTNSRTALILILGSSPMVEGIPAFFAAGKYGVGLIVIMSLVFGISTIATYVVLCTLSTTRLQNVKLGTFEKYGEVFSGAFIALVGLVFWIWPVL
jgi:ABC-type nickel/cobalt efflux system permease component RcnA